MAGGARVGRCDARGGGTPRAADRALPLLGTGWRPSARRDCSGAGWSGGTAGLSEPGGRSVPVIRLWRTGLPGQTRRLLARLLRAGLPWTGGGLGAVGDRLWSGGGERRGQQPGVGHRSSALARSPAAEGRNSRSRASSRMAIRDCPPRSKKSSSGPSSGAPRTSRKRPRTVDSGSPPGPGSPVAAVPAVAGDPGTVRPAPVPVAAVPVTTAAFVTVTVAQSLSQRLSILPCGFFGRTDTRYSTLGTAQSGSCSSSGATSASLSAAVRRTASPGSGARSGSAGTVKAHSTVPVVGSGNTTACSTAGPRTGRVPPAPAPAGGRGS